jgi:hypothetical protein
MNPIIYGLAGIGALVVLALVLYWIVVIVAVLKSKRFARVVADPVLKAEDEALMRIKTALDRAVPSIVQASEMITQARGTPKQ